MIYEMRDWTNSTHDEHEKRRYGYCFSNKKDNKEKIRIP